MSLKTFKWGYLNKSPDTSGSEPNWLARVVSLVPFKVHSLGELNE